jgi:hypothetical protein
MGVTSIRIGKERICFEIDGMPASPGLRVCERVPIACERPGRVLSRLALEEDGGIPRFDGCRDRLASAFTLSYEGSEVPGIRHADSFAVEAHAAVFPYPQPDTIKAIHATLEDMRILGARQCTYNVNLPALMTLSPKDEDIGHSWAGKPYWFVWEAVKRLDADLTAYDRAGVLVTLILLNSPKLFGSLREPALLDMALHPRYDAESPDAFISAFNTVEEDGLGLFGAFASFLAARYTREDRRYGRACGAIISNEVDSQYVWGNAGEQPVAQYVREYSIALRTAWLAGQAAYSGYRVYVSLDHYWHGLRHKPHQPLRYYPGREVLDALQAVCAADGDFGWHVAHHPYPENLAWPNFWVDRTAAFHFDTPRITFRNMEVLSAYLEQPHLLYHKAPRRIIFSEQGFNSMDGALAGWSEQAGVAGYTLAYLKARNLPTVDMFTHHAYTDNPREFGLNLGIRRYDLDREDHVGNPKPIYRAVMDMDTDREAEQVAAARAFVGADLFDSTLHPDITRGGLDSLETLFG